MARTVTISIRDEDESYWRIFLELVRLEGGSVSGRIMLLVREYVDRHLGVVAENESV